MYRAIQKRAGFTIVELLIVIVVIAILAAITIVAYNGISGRAKASAAQSAASQASKKILTYASTNSDQLPADLATAGVSASGDTTFQYSVNNASTPRTYCVTATNGNTSYFINNTTNTSPTTGGCVGHGQNGLAAITNLVTNASFETTVSPWSYSSGSGGTATFVRQPSVGIGGGAAGRMSWSVVPSPSTPFMTLGSGGSTNRPILISQNTTYRVSAWVKPSWSSKAYIGATAYDDSDASTSAITGSTFDLTAGVWTRLDTTLVAGANSTTMFLRIYIPSAGLTGLTTSSTFDVDQVMVTQGSALYNYGDGASPNWLWNGSPYISTSTGPQL